MRDTRQRRQQRDELLILQAQENRGQTAGGDVSFGKNSATLPDPRIRTRAGARLASRKGRGSEREFATWRQLEYWDRSATVRDVAER